MYRLKNQKGFTLLEILVVTVIIGILASFTTANLMGGVPRARDTQRKNDLKQLQTALQLYYADNNQYPPSDSCQWSSQTCWQTLLGEDTARYINPMPKDPLDRDLGFCETKQNCYVYRYCRPVADQYILVANLENTQDSEKKVDNPNCGTGGPTRFWVTNP